MTYIKINLKNQKILAIICFSLFFTWILVLPFEGQLFYSAALGYNVDPSPYVFLSTIAHFCGLFLCGYFVKNQISAKFAMIISILLCLSGTMVFLLPFSSLWLISLIISSFFAGIFVASVGYFIKNYWEPENRHKSAADVLIYSNIIMIGVNVITVNYSIKAGFLVTISLLILALASALKLEANPSCYVSQPEPKIQQPIGILKPFIVLCVFITLITINSGLMYRVVNPAFSHLATLASYYWAVPYIAALLILRYIPSKINKAYILYIALAMIGLSYIAFMLLPRNAMGYIIIDTLMLGAFGVCDLFWWSILLSFFEYSDNPAKMLGIGLSMNVFGILIGGYIGNEFLFKDNTITSDTSIIALIIIFVVLMMLPVLNHQLGKLFKNHMFLVDLARKMELEDPSVIDIQGIELLTEKEKQVVEFLLKGYTYKGIAEQLFISENTLKYHIKNIYQKLNISSKMELIKRLT